MKELTVYDPAMCCSTGVCGPQVDGALVRFAGDLKWLSDQRVKVRRFNLSQNPGAFVENEAVRAALHQKGEAALPLLVANGQVAAMGRYPDRDELCRWFGLINPSLPKLTLTPKSGGCCDEGAC